MKKSDGATERPAPRMSRRTGDGASVPQHRPAGPDHGRVTAEPETAQGLIKLSLNLSSDLFDGVERAALQRRVTKTEVMRRAISVHLFLEEVRSAEGGRLELFVKRQGMLQQVVFPWFI